MDSSSVNQILNPCMETYIGDEHIDNFCFNTLSPLDLDDKKKNKKWKNILQLQKKEKHSNKEAQLGDFTRLCHFIKQFENELVAKYKLILGNYVNSTIFDSCKTMSSLSVVSESVSKNCPDNLIDEISNISIIIDAIKSMELSACDRQIAQESLNQIQQSEALIQKARVTSFNEKLELGKSLVAAVQPKLDPNKSLHFQAMQAKMVDLKRNVDLIASYLSESIQTGFNNIASNDNLVLPNFIETKFNISNIQDYKNNKAFSDYINFEGNNGFLLKSNQNEFDSLESHLGGHWNSYHLFQQWLADTARWQWFDIQSKQRLLKQKRDLDNLITEKIKYYTEEVNLRLARLCL